MSDETFAPPWDPAVQVWCACQHPLEAHHGGACRWPGGCDCLGAHGVATLPELVDLGFGERPTALAITELPGFVPAPLEAVPLEADPPAL